MELPYAKIKAEYLFQGRYDIFMRELERLHEELEQQGGEITPSEDHILIKYVTKERGEKRNDS